MCFNCFKEGKVKRSFESCKHHVECRPATPSYTPVMEYITLKQNVSELEKKRSDWERKIEIAHMETTRLNQTSMKMSRSMKMK